MEKNTVYITDFTLYFMQTYTTLWEGSIRVSDLEIKFDAQYNYVPDKAMKNRRETFWKAEKAKYPDIFDGDILFCKDFEIKEDGIIFLVGHMKYSYLNIILRDNITFGGNAGYFAFRARVGGDSFLIGQKPADAQFDPEHYTLPGGLFDLEDVEKGIFSGCYREILEETGLKIKPENVRLIAINKHRRQNGVILLFQIAEEINNLKENEEWKKSSLRRINIEGLQSLNYGLLHDDIRYFLH